MRRAAACLLALAALAGCGGEPEREAALPGVRLAVQAPADTATTVETSVEVAGTVAPAGATVLVAGEDASAAGGRFTHTVALAPGVNVIDVQAAAPRRPAAMTAVRVTRQVAVEIPDVSDAEPDDARARLTALGFEVQERLGGGLLDDLIPGGPGVCGTDPEAGEEALPGTTVVLELRNSC